MKGGVVICLKDGGESSSSDGRVAAAEVLCLTKQRKMVCCNG